MMGRDDVAGDGTGVSRREPTVAAGMAVTHGLAPDVFVQLAERSGDFIGIADLELVPRYANPVACQLVGIESAEQLARMSIADLFFPEDWPFIRDELLPRTLQHGSAATEVRFRHLRTGEAIWMDYGVSLLRGDDGAPTGYATVSRDITNQRVAEEALREGEARQTFLLALGDRLRPLSDPNAITAAAAEMLGRELGVAGVGYFDVDMDGDTITVGGEYTDGRTPSIAGRRRFSDFGEGVGSVLRAGQGVFATDITTDHGGPAGGSDQTRVMGLRAVAAVPLIKGGRLVACLYATHPEPRAWDEAERRLLHEVAERTWEVVERARAEGALRASEAKYRTLFESIDEGVCIVEMVLDGDGRPADYRFLETNPAFETMTGLRDAVGRRVHELVPDLEPFWHETYGDVALTGRPVRFVNQSVPMGRWFDVYAARTGDPADLRVAIVFTDITARRAADEQLRTSEERFRTLIQRSADAVQLVLPDGTILYSSDSVEAVLGYRPGEIADRSIAPYVHPDDLAAVVKWVAEVAATPGRVGSLQYRVRHKDGSWAWLETTLANHLETPNIEALVGNFRNVTARKRIEAEREAFVDAAAHDLRTPLATMRAHSQRLLRRARRGEAMPPELIASGLTAVDDATGRMVALIDEMMDAAHLRAERALDLDVDPTDLVPLARSAAEEARRNTARHAIRVAPGVPALVGNWDEARIRRVLGNLLGNAVKYSPRGGDVTVHVDREERDDGSWAVLTVTDQGIGIPAADMPYLFERFRRGGNVTGNIAGTGIGLAGARQIVEQHGGTMSVESQEGAGATFTVRLPLPRDQENRE